PNTLYFTAGGSSQTSGLFATLAPASTTTNADFSLALSAQSATLTPGQSANLTVSASAVGGFNSPISLTCSQPAGITCSLSPSTITPGSSTSTSTLSFTAAAMAPTGGYGGGMAMNWLSLSGVGALGMVFAIRRGEGKRASKILKHGLWGGGLGVLALCVLLSVGCGGGSSSSSHQQASTVTVMVTGTSGSISHSTPVTLTIQRLRNQNENHCPCLTGNWRDKGRVPFGNGLGCRSYKTCALGRAISPVVSSKGRAAFSRRSEHEQTVSGSIVAFVGCECWDDGRRGAEFGGDGEQIGRASCRERV